MAAGEELAENGPLTGRAIVEVLRAEIGIVLEWFHAQLFLLVPQLLHLTEHPQKVLARQLGQILNGPSIAQEFRE